jgi:casein kinase 1
LQEFWADSVVRDNGQASRQLFITDFTVFKRYRDLKTRAHSPYADGKQPVGSPRFMSINTHLGLEQGRRDDMEMLGYVWISFLQGSLPWDQQPGKHHRHKVQLDSILEKKMITSYQTLCQGLPVEFVKYFELVRSLEFEQEPAYEEYRQMFQAVAAREGIQFDFLFDWCPPVVTKEKQAPEKVPMHAPVFGDSEIKDHFLDPHDSLEGPPDMWNISRRGCKRTTMPRGIFEPRPIGPLAGELEVHNIARQNLETGKFKL